METPLLEEPGGWLSRLIRKHLLIGWSGLLIFLTLGIALEVLHGLKVSYYLDTRNVTRRLMWTLGHAHGTLFSVVNVAFALSVARVGAASEKRLRLASTGLLGGLIFLPAGFFLGGVKVYEGDPGFGIFLVPLGALLFLVGVGSFAVDLRQMQGRQKPPNEPGVPPPVKPGAEKSLPSSDPGRTERLRPASGKPGRPSRG